MARETGLSISSIGHYVRMTSSPISTTTGDWLDSAVNVAAVFSLDPEALWPDHMRELTINKATAAFELDLPEVMAIRERGFDQLEMRELIGQLSGGLNDRERDIIASRFTGSTFDDLGERYGICRERVRQIGL